MTSELSGVSDVCLELSGVSDVCLGWVSGACVAG